MVSQELRPGFSSGGVTGGDGWPSEDSITDPLGMTGYGSASGNNLNTNASINQAMFGELTSVVDKPLKPELLKDMTEYLNNYSLELFSASSSNFLNSALKMTQNGSEQKDAEDDVCNAVIQGTREVSVPPGEWIEKYPLNCVHWMLKQGSLP